ncbi:MAG TPA: YbjQ family protein [Gemmatimonadales bacterium]
MAISSSMIVSTTFDVQGRRVREYKGVVRGITVRAPTISQGILGGLKSIIGGQIGAYTEMCEQARQAAYDLMVEHARQVGANAILGVSFDASEVAARASATEVLCYGTAVVLE